VTPAFRGALAKGIRLVLFLTLPCAVGLSILAQEIVSLLFEHGKFTAYDVAMTAGPLQAYAFGLVFYSAIKVLQPAFYTIDKRFIPMMVSLGIIALNASLNSFTVFVMHWDHTALAWATALGLAVNFAALYLSMRKFAGGLETKALTASLIRLLIGIGSMVAVCYGLKMYLLADWAKMSFLAQAAGLGTTVTLAAVIYFLVTQKLRVEEAGEFIGIVSKRIKR
jgi:putative peptidoglycan lipid II flippase